MNKYKKRPGFTIVELLVVIVVIAILAVISLVAYGSVSSRAISASLQSDLANASTQIKSFEVDNGNYPTTISTDCSTTPDSPTNKCIKLSPGNTLIGYSASNTASNKSFTLITSNKTITGSGTITYKVTNTTSPTQISDTMQPNVTPGAILELHAAKANNGTSPGINSPLTTTWTDTSGNGNDGTLVNYIGLNAAPWGDGKLESVAASPMPYVNLGTNPIFDLTSGVTMEVWVWTTKTNNQQLIAKSYGTSYYMNMSQSVGNSAFSAFIGGRSVVASVADYGLHGRLVHLVATGDASLLQLFADGQRLNFTTGQAPRADTYPLQVGGYNNVGAFVGSMYLARIYPFALSAAQVQQNYNAGTGW